MLFKDIISLFGFVFMLNHISLKNLHWGSEQLISFAPVLNNILLKGENFTNLTLLCFAPMLNHIPLKSQNIIFNMVSSRTLPVSHKISLSVSLIRFP